MFMLGEILHCYDMPSVCDIAVNGFCERSLTTLVPSVA